MSTRQRRIALNLRKRRRVAAVVREDGTCAKCGRRRAHDPWDFCITDCTCVDIFGNPKTKAP